MSFEVNRLVLRPVTYSEIQPRTADAAGAGHLPLRQGIRHARITAELCQLQHLREAKTILVTQQVDFLSVPDLTSCLLADDIRCRPERRCERRVFRRRSGVSATTPKHVCCMEIRPKAEVAFMYTRDRVSPRATPKIRGATEPPSHAARRRAPASRAVLRAHCRP